MEAALRIAILSIVCAPSAALLHQPARPWRVRAQRAGIVHCNEAADDSTPTTMSAAAANEALSADGESWSVLDVRMEAEYRLEGHIEGSVSLPSHSWEHGFFLPLDYPATVHEEEYSSDTPLLLYCATGARSAAACQSLREAGFTRARVLEGGIAAWEEEGLPLVTDEDGEAGLVGAWV
mmetsp:Transcript_408/g.1025  ORF Transcript_408/g.1025 Transcript_408/m.1025 type:complete len:179 (-) Transcript_408:235-771(-)